MKYTAQTQSKALAMSTETASGSLLTRPRWITGLTVGDTTIRELLDDARRENDERLMIACSKALRRTDQCSTGQAIARRQRARHVCAEEINSRIAQWLQFREPCWYQKYTQLLDTKTATLSDTHFAWVSHLVREDSFGSTGIDDTIDMDPNGD